MHGYYFQVNIRFISIARADTVQITLIFIS
jgi:hypothetical protein